MAIQSTVLFDNFSIIHKLLELYKIFDTVTKGLSKHSRYTLGIKIENEILTILELATNAIVKTDEARLELLGKIDARIKFTTLLVRLLYQTKAIDEKKYIICSEKVTEISSMIGGWITATKRKQPNPVA